MKSMQRILILRGGAIGDFVLTTPVFSSLRQTWPAVHIDLAAYARVRALALECGLADGFRSLDEPDFARLFDPGAELPAAWSNYVAASDVVVSFLHDPDGVAESNLLRSGAGRVIGVSPEVEGEHAVDHLLRPLARLGITLPTGAAPVMRLPEERREQGRRRADAHGGGVVTIHPGSGSRTKNWAADRFAALVKRVRAETPYTPLIVLGEADDAAGEAVRAAVDVPVIRNLGLLELAGLLAASRCHVDNDSGIAHLAAAVGCPTVAIFGPTDPALWGPRGRAVRIVRGEGAAPLAGVEVARVWEAVSALCVP